MNKKSDDILLCSDCEDYPCYRFECNENLESSECDYFKSKYTKGKENVCKNQT